MAHPSRSSADVAVLDALDRGDLRAAGTLLMREYGSAVVRYLRSILRDEAAAGDAFSQWAECVWRGLGGFRREGSLRSWVFRLAFNSAMHLREDAWHRRGRRLATGEASALADTIRTGTAPVFEARKHALDELRRELSAEEAALLSLRIDQKLCWKEIAEALSGEEGMPIDANAIQKRFERLTRRLRRMAEERGLL